jgi:hypothetical protein
MLKPFREVINEAQAVPLKHAVHLDHLKRETTSVQMSGDRERERERERERGREKERGRERKRQTEFPSDEI